MGIKGPKIVKRTLKKENKVGRFMVPDFKTYYKVAVIKTVRHQHKHRQINQWIRIKSLEIGLDIWTIHF